MFRIWVAVAVGVLGVALTAVLSMAVGKIVRDREVQEVQSRVLAAQTAFPSLDRLRGIDATSEAAALAREDEFADIFGKNTDEARQAAFVAVQARNARLEQAGRKADLVAVVDASGKVLSRDLNPKAMQGEDLKAKYPSVGRALDGVANKDIWLFNGQMYRVASAPIRSRQGAISGALVIGYVASQADALSDRQRLGTDVAYFYNYKVEASSFAMEGGERKMEALLAEALFTKDKVGAEAADGKPTPPIRLRLRDHDYIAAAGPLPGNVTKSQSGFVVLASVSDAVGIVGELKSWILSIGILMMLIAVGGSVLVARRFIVALDQIEVGVAEVIAGNRDYQFQSPGTDFEGLANALNTMVARLLGRPDPDADTAGRWGGMFAVEEVTANTLNVSPENRALAQEEEGRYLERLFREYVEARRASGESIEGLTLDGFTAKVRQTEAALKKKYGSSSVRFRVVVKSGQTTLKPVPITA